jgi:hypothetical protein
MAIPWLHVLSQHPIHLAWYAGIGNDRPSAGSKASRDGGFHRGKDFAARVAKLGRSFVRAAAYRTGSMEGSRGPGTLLTPPVPKADVIILSWLVHVDHLEEEEDFYFGKLQTLLGDRGLSSLLLLRNQSGVPAAKLVKRALRKGAASRMMLPDAHAMGEETALLYRCVKARREFKGLLRGTLPALHRRVIRRACREQLSEETVGNLRLHGQIREICRRINPTMVVGMYEGHASERCTWNAARTSSTEPRICVGYQHTTLREHAHAAKRSIGKDRQYDPDIILTLGDATRKTLMSCQALDGTDFITLGTHRRGGEGCADGAAKPDAAFLVLPEGIPSECIYLFNFALECAHRLLGHRFIFRTHPVLPFDRIRGRLRGYGKMPLNVEISRHRDINDDFARSSAVLYRGSSAVFYAVLWGLKPFYVSRRHEMDIDPLHDISRWREHVRSVDDLLDQNRAYQSQDPEQRQKDWGFARDYCRSYALPIREGAVDVLIETAGKRMRANREDA